MIQAAKSGLFRNSRGTVIRDKRTVVNRKSPESKVGMSFLEEGRKFGRVFFEQKFNGRK